jgi:large subunit ribosomal protein L36
VKVVKSLKSLKQKDGSIVVRRHGKVFVINKRNPRWKARQG